jgi:hypothetical protein
MHAAAIADLNGDGIPDLVAPVDRGPGNPDSALSVLLGTGDGNFGQPMLFPTGYQPGNVVLGDLNGDGKLDAVVSANSELDVLMGNGDGTFQPYQTVANGLLLVNPQLADLDGDGHLDIVSSSQTTGGFVTLGGNGDGTFQAPVFYSTPSSSASEAVGDLTGNGRQDVVMGTASGVEVWLNDGDTFHLANSYAGGPGVKLGDMNDDGKLDIVTWDGSNQFSVLLGNGNGTFQPGVSFSTDNNVSFAGLADVNGDHLLDVLSTDVGTLVGVRTNATGSIYHP